MTPESRDNLLDLLCKGSDREIDASIKPALQELKGKPIEEVKDGLLAVMDDCVRGTLVSGFTFAVLQTFWCQCGGSEKEITARYMHKVSVTPLPKDTQVYELRPGPSAS